MRIAGLIENGERQFHAVRRKGKTSTLLTPEGQPVTGGDNALAPFLVNANRAFFERMFSLDHVRLRTGGREILDAKDDVGQMLFAASAGMSGLRRDLDEMQIEADGLWGKRRSTKRRYYQAFERFENATAKLRNATFKTSDYSDLKKAHDDDAETSRKVDDDFKACSARLNRSSLIRRVHRNVQLKTKLERDIAGMTDVVPLPKDASLQLDDASKKISIAETRISTFSTQLEQEQAKLAGLGVDDALAQHADESDRLKEERIQTLRSRDDLPKREAELAGHEREFLIHASQLGWTETGIAALESRMPKDVRLREMRALLQNHEGIETELKN